MNQDDLAAMRKKLDAWEQAYDRAIQEGRTEDAEYALAWANAIRGRLAQFDGGTKRREAR